MHIFYNHIQKVIFYHKPDKSSIHIGFLEVIHLNNYTKILFLYIHIDRLVYILIEKNKTIFYVEL